MAALGVFGQKVMFDTRYNWGVNTKGGFQFDCTM